MENLCSASINFLTFALICTYPSFSTILCLASSPVAAKLANSNAAFRLSFNLDKRKLTLPFLTKRLLFNDNKYCKRGRRTETLKDKVLKITRTTEDRFHKDALNRKFRHDHPYGLDRQKSSN